jgi:hypothetical protein
VVSESTQKDQGDHPSIVDDDNALPGEHPHLVALTPMFDRKQMEGGSGTSEIVGVLFSVLTWDKFMTDLIHEDSHVGTCVTVANSCDQEYSYTIKGGNVCPFHSYPFVSRRNNKLTKSILTFRQAILERVNSVREKVSLNRFNTLFTLAGQACQPGI